MSSVRISESARDGRNLLVYSTQREGLSHIFSYNFRKLYNSMQKRKVCEEDESNAISKINEYIAETAYFV